VCVVNDEKQSIQQKASYIYMYKQSAEGELCLCAHVFGRRLQLLNRQYV